MGRRKKRGKKKAKEDKEENLFGNEEVDEERDNFSESSESNFNLDGHIECCVHCSTNISAKRVSIKKEISTSCFNCGENFHDKELWMCTQDGYTGCLEHVIYYFTQFEKQVRRMKRKRLKMLKRQGKSVQRAIIYNLTTKEMRCLACRCEIGRVRNFRKKNYEDMGNFINGLMDSNHRVTEGKMGGRLSIRNYKEFLHTMILHGTFKKSRKPKFEKTENDETTNEIEEKKLSEMDELLFPSTYKRGIPKCQSCKTLDFKDPHKFKILYKKNSFICEECYKSRKGKRFSKYDYEVYFHKKYIGRVSPENPLIFPIHENDCGIVRIPFPKNYHNDRINVKVEKDDRFKKEELEKRKNEVIDENISSRKVIEYFSRDDYDENEKIKLFEEIKKNFQRIYSEKWNKSKLKYEKRIKKEVQENKKLDLENKKILSSIHSLKSKEKKQQRRINDLERKNKEITKKQMEMENIIRELKKKNSIEEIFNTQNFENNFNSISDEEILNEIKSKNEKIMEEIRRKYEKMNEIITKKICTLNTNICKVCYEEKVSIGFSCGHLYCESCSKKIGNECSFCRVIVKYKTKMYL